MEIRWDSTYIDLQNLISISRGDRNRMLKYLIQFRELIPPRIEKLKKHLQSQDRKMIRRALHQMSPQLQFFGVPDVVEPIRKLELEYETISIEDLKSLVNNILIKLEQAGKEVEQILKNHFE